MNANLVVKPNERVTDLLKREVENQGDMFADQLADAYTQCRLAGGKPRLEDFLDACPNEEVRTKVKSLCNFENLVALAAEEDEDVED